MEPTSDRERFVALIQHWHADHERPDQVQHCLNVAHLLEQALALGDLVSTESRRVMVLAALGHDLYEDSAIPHSDIVAGFGAQVDAMIQELTEDTKNGGVAEYVERVAIGSEEARLIKFCDGIDNYGGLIDNGLVQREPARWIKIVRDHMEPMFTRLVLVPFAKYPRGGAWLSGLLQEKRERFWKAAGEPSETLQAREAVGLDGMKTN
jgi:hypothetical protein